MKKLKRLDLRQLRQIDWRGVLRKKWVWFTAVSVLTFLIGLCFFTAFRHAGNTLRSQHMAEEYTGDGELEFAQVSVFVPEGKSIGDDDIWKFRETTRVNTQDLVPETVKNLYLDAWSTKGSVNVKGEHGSSDATATAVGGDFFLLHPQNLLSGGYISSDDLMHDRVILDEELAWKLFGGYDLTGLPVEIGGSTFYVAGVIARETDWATEKAYTDGAGLYMSYEAYKAMNEGAYISCYEAIIPEPVENFAKMHVADNFAPKDAVVVVNSGRYSVGNVFSLLKNMGQRTMRTDTVYYPYWENAARLVENRCMVLLVLAVLFWVCPAVFAVTIAVKTYRKSKRKLHETYLDLKDQYENRVLFQNLKEKLKGKKHGGTDS